MEHCTLTIAYSVIHNRLKRHAARAIKALIALFGLMVGILLCSSTIVIQARQSEITTKLLLTEIFYDTPGMDSEQEWVELANFGLEEVVLSNYKLGDEEQPGGKEGMLRFPKDSVIAPGQIIIVAQDAQGFRALFGRDPDYEISGSDPAVPKMRRFAIWSVGKFLLANDGDEVILLDDKNRQVDSINYGDKSTFFDPAISGVYTGQSIARVPMACDSDSAADWQPSRVPTPGEQNHDGECSFVEKISISDSQVLPIGQIQGAGDVSPYVNQKVDFYGVVTGMLEDKNVAGITFYTLLVQDAPGQEDGDPNTSDGIAVFLGRHRPTNEIGDFLRITGQVTEFFGLTEIDDNGLKISEVKSDSLLPEAEPLNLPADSVARSTYYEAREGMLVTMTDVARVVGPTHSGCGFAVTELDSNVQMLPRQRAGDSSALVLLVLHNSDVDCHDLPDLKAGDAVSGLSGPLIYHFDKYKLVQQDSGALFVKPAPWALLASGPLLSAGQFSVASFNLENYFDDSKDMPNSAEPELKAESLAIKQRKLAYTLTHTLGCPTLVGVQEVENEELLRELVAQTAAQCGFEYQISHRDSVDSRGLDVALISDPRRVQILDVELRQTCTTLDTGIIDKSIDCPNQKSALFGRPPLQVDLLVDGQPYSFIVNHLKSKRDGELATAERRLEQARHLRDLANQQSRMTPEAGIVVLGDFNDYELSPTVTQMSEGANLYNVLERVPKENRYSYIFDGVPQLIDGILVSEQIVPQIATVTILHVNADYPVALAADLSANFMALRASDHDLPLLILNLTKGEPGTTAVLKTEHKTDPLPSVESTISASFEPTPRLGPNVSFWLPVVLILLGLGTLLVIYKVRFK